MPRTTNTETIKREQRAIEKAGTIVELYTTAKVNNEELDSILATLIRGSKNKKERAENIAVTIAIVELYTTAKVNNEELDSILATLIRGSKNKKERAENIAVTIAIMEIMPILRLTRHIGMINKIFKGTESPLV